VQLASPAENARQAGLRDAFLDRVLDALPGARVFGPRTDRLCTNACVGFDGVPGRELVVALDRLGIQVSRGSACASGSTRPSAVLSAMGVPEALALTAIRVSVGRTTTMDDIEAAIAALKRAVASMRGGR